MVQLADSDIQTREVLTWQGVHLLHFSLSSCSQKTRIFLALKGIDWQSHPVDLRAEENFSDWFLGINPRGLVPVLVHDGVVHIDSNDILFYLEKTFPQPCLFPSQRQAEIGKLLNDENDLHLDLRTLTFRYILARDGPPKSAAGLAVYETGGAGTVGGRQDPWKQVELAFWHDAAKHGITDAAVRDSAVKFHTALKAYDALLVGRSYLLGEQLTVVDIAWFIYANRLRLAGYPLHELHPRVGMWYDKLLARPEFCNDIPLPPELAEGLEVHQAQEFSRGTALRQVAGF